MTSAPVSVPTIALDDDLGVAIPQLGLGVWQVDDREAERAVGHAIDAGYRSIDTAAAYRNEPGVGRAIAGAAERGVARDELFVTSKVWNSQQGYERARASFDSSLNRLGLDVIDLFLIHWPAPTLDRYVDTWRALVELKGEGRVRSIGVSNFLPEHISRLVDETGVAPAVNQIELHPYSQQRESRRFHAELGIVTEAYSPLGSGQGLLDDPVIRRVADNAGVTPAQAVLAWELAQGVVVIPKSVTPARIEENLRAVGARLSAADIGGDRRPRSRRALRAGSKGFFVNRRHGAPFQWRRDLLAWRQVRLSGAPWTRVGADARSRVSQST